MRLSFLVVTPALLLAAGPTFAQAQPPPPVNPAGAAPPQPAAPAPAPAPPPAEVAPPPSEPAPPVLSQPEPVLPPTSPADHPPEPPHGIGAQTEAKEPVPPPQKIAVGKQGYFQPAALLQGWFLVDHQKGLNTEPGHDTWNTFRLRRAELRIKGQIIPDLIAYQVMIDPAKLLRFESKKVNVEPTDPNAPATVAVPQPPNDTSILQDFYVTFLSEYAEVSLGQFKIPLSWEGYNSASKLIMPERSLSSRTFGDKRDLGIRVEKKFEHFGYMAGIYNGLGQNRFDNNNQKDVSLRLEAYPIEGVVIGAVGYAAVGERNEPDTKDRLEGDVRFEKYNVLVQAEYLHGWTRNAAGTRLNGHGGYAALGYTFFDKL
jgi:hypothetical protein